MSKFVTDKLTKIDLGDGEWVKVPSAVSFNLVRDFTKVQADSDMEKSMEMLIVLVKGWNLKDEDDKPAELTPDNLKRLDMKYINIIIQELLKIMGIDDKKKASKGMQG